jgi:hypothetical protein
VKNPKETSPGDNLTEGDNDGKRGEPDDNEDQTSSDRLIHCGFMLESNCIHKSLILLLFIL